MSSVPSVYPHPLYRVEKLSNIYESWEERVKVGTTDRPGSSTEPASLVSSQIDGTDHHTVMLDIDMRAALIPSSTPGHSHLYVDHSMPWRKYKRLLRALCRAGVIEKGFYKASVRRRATFLRLPGVRKGDPQHDLAIKYT